jgi:polar amino acid transport system substrate-binding protein
MKKIAIFLFAVLLLVGSGLLLKGCSNHKERKTFLIGRGSDWFTLPLMGKEQNLAGFIDDLFQAISALEKNDFQAVIVPSEYLTKGLDEGNYNGIITIINPTAYSNNQYAFSDSFFLIGPVLVLPENSPYKSIEDMSGKQIGISRGASTVFDLNTYPSIIIIPYENVLFALEGLNRGDLDGVIMGMLPAYIYTKSLFNGKLRVATGPLTKDGFRVVALKNAEGIELVAEFNDGLKKLRDNGTYDKLITKWTLFNP